MTDTHHLAIERRHERGSALLGVMLLLMLMSALAAALAVSGETETLISRNQRDGARAHAAAEAGLNHAVELATTFIFNWSNNGFGSADAAVDALLIGPDGVSGSAPDDEDNGGFDARGTITAEIPHGEAIALAGKANLSYGAVLIDDVTPPAGKPEDGNVVDDTNTTVIVRSTGFGPDGTRVTLEAVLTAFPFPAVATNADLILEGSFSVSGSSGSIHTNEDLLTNGSGTASGDITAVGSNIPNPGGLTDPGNTIIEGAPEIELPPVSAADYRNQADFVLDYDASGPTFTVKDGAGNILHTMASTADVYNGWKYQTGGAYGPSWVSNGTTSAGTYYSNINIQLNGGGLPTAMTLIAEGNIDIGGTPMIWSDTPGVLLIADKDIHIAGNPGSTFSEGAIRAHEQIELSGNVSISGSVMAEDAAATSDLVIDDKINGNVSITYSGGLNGDVFGVSGWREVR